MQQHSDILFSFLLFPFNLRASVPKFDQINRIFLKEPCVATISYPRFSHSIIRNVMRSHCYSRKISHEKFTSSDERRQKEKFPQHRKIKLQSALIELFKEGEFIVVHFYSFSIKVQARSLASL